MHENLKFNLITKSKEWQPIVASQVHGTFFGVFMKFENFDLKKQTHNCSFYIQNFRGMITLGIERPIEVICKFDSKLKKNIFIMDFTVVPFSNCKKIKEINVDFKGKFKQDDFLDAQFRIGHPPLSLYDPKKLDDSLYIDPYKFYRDGECYIPIKFDHKNSICSDNESVYVSEVDPLRRPNGICDMTISKIIIR